MRRQFAIAWVLFLLLVPACTRQEGKKESAATPGVGPGVVVAPPNGKSDPVDKPPPPGKLIAIELPPDTVSNFLAPPDPNAEKYETALAEGLSLLADQKVAQALIAFESAKTFKDTEFVRAEIDKLKSRLDQESSVQKTVQDIQAVLQDGKAAEAAQLASKALGEFGAGDEAPKLVQLQVQANALSAAQSKESDAVRFERLRDDGQVALRDGNLRAAAIAFEQALQLKNDPALSQHLAEVEGSLRKYDAFRKKAGELRREPEKLEEAIELLREAAKTWDTLQVRQEIDELTVALQRRRDTLSVADFEVRGEVGFGDAGRVIAEDLLPLFKGKFDLVERAQVQEVVKELNLAQSFAENPEQQREVGKLARVRFLVLGTVRRLGNLSVTARLVDARSGLIVQTGQIYAATPEQLFQRMPELARQLMMTDDEKLAFDQEQMKQAQRIAPVPDNAPLPAAPDGQPMAGQPLDFHAPPPEVGDLKFEQFQRLPQAPAVMPGVVADAPPAVFGHRLLHSVVTLGDGHFAQGHYREAYRHYEFALTLAPGDFAIRDRLERVRMFLQPVVIVQPRQPRLALLPFVVVGHPRVVPPGLGVWTPDHLMPYFCPAYEIVDYNEVFWMMGRLGMSLNDLMVNPSARRWLGRALNIQVFLLGTIEETASFNVSTYLINAEHGFLHGSARMHVRNSWDLKLRMSELAQITQMPPARRVEYLSREQDCERLIERGRVSLGNGNFGLSISLFEDALRLRPGNLQLTFFLDQANSRRRAWEVEERRRKDHLVQQAKAEEARRRQGDLARAAELASAKAAHDAGGWGEADRRRQVDVKLAAYRDLIGKARNASQTKNYSGAMTWYQGALDLFPPMVPGAKGPPAALPVGQDVLVRELAQVRAAAAKASEEKALAEKLAAQEAALRRQREAELAAARQKLEDEQRKAQAKALAQKQLTDAKYQAAFDQGQLLMSQGKYEAAIVALQGARQLKKTPVVDEMLNTAIQRQAESLAAKKGEEERLVLERRLIEERKRRKAAESEAKQNRELYEATLKQAQLALDKKDFDQAEQSYHQAAKYFNNDAVRTGLKRVQAGRAEQLASLQAAKEKADRSERVAQLLSAGKSSLDAGNVADGVQKLQAARKLDPTNVEVLAALTQAEQLRNRQLAELRRKSDDAERQKTFDRLLANGRINVKNKQYDAAIAALSEALKLKAGDPGARAALEEAQKLQSAESVSAKVQAEQKLKLAEYQKLIGQGRLALSTKRYADAIASFEAAQKLLPGDQASADFLHQARKGRQVEQDALAAAAKERAAKIQLQSDMKKALGDGLTHLRANNFDAAQKSLEQANQLIPNDPRVIAALRDVEAGRKRAQESALAEAKQLQQYQSLVKEGQISIAARKYDEAIKSLQSAVALRPGDPSARDLLLQAQKASSAANAASQAAKEKALAEAMAMQQYQAFVKAGQQSMALKKFDDAVRALQGAIALKPGDPQAMQLLQQAQVQWQAAKTAEAGALQYRKLVAEGQRLLNAKQFTQAITPLQDAIKLNPADPTAPTLLRQAQAGIVEQQNELKKKTSYFEAVQAGQKLAAQQKFAEAMQALLAAKSIYPSEPQVNQIIHQTTQAWEAAKKSAVQPKVDPQPKVIPKNDPAVQARYLGHLQRGNQLLLQRQFEAAAREFDAALQIRPGDPVATKLLERARKK